MKRAGTAVALLVLAVVAALAAALLRLQQHPEPHPADAEALAARIAALEAGLAHRVDAAPAPAADLDALAARLAAIEQRLTAMEAATSAAADAAGDTAPSVRERAPLYGSGADAAMPLAADVLGERHAAETGQSDWGVATADQLNWQYAEAPFFAEHGGRFDADCRQSVCRLRWQPPSTEGLEAPEAEMIQGLAGYELLALIAKGAHGIGPIHSSSRLRGADPRIELYFARKPTD